MPAKMKQIAELVGVSESTVSRALNNSTLISEKTRNQVFDAARKLHYQISRTRMIGVIEPKITNPLYSEVISAIETRAYEAGYGLLLCNSSFDLDREHGQVNFLLRQAGVQGIILIPIDPKADHIRALASQNIPCVILGTEAIPGSDQVNVDTSLGAYLITRHFLDLGHRRIGLIQGPERVAACRDRLRGYSRALSEYQLPFDNELVAYGEVDESGGAVAMHQLISRQKTGVSAILAVSDVMALGALRVLREIGIRVPEEISLAGCDDIPVASLVQPPLTTVWQPKHELGILAVKFLLNQIESRNELGEDWKIVYPFQSTMYHPHIVVRESTRIRI